MSSSCLRVGLAGLGKGEHRVDDRQELARLNQFANLDQLLAIGLDDKKDKARVMPLSYSTGWLGTYDGDKRASGPNHLPGALQGVAANRIQDQINAPNYLLEVLGGVVDNLVGPQLAQEIVIACRGSGNDPRPRPMSELDGKDSYTASATMDQHGLPHRQVRLVKEGLPGSQRRERHRGRLDVVKRARFGRQLVGQGNGVISPLRGFDVYYYISFIRIIDI